jgi:hypothetical protein
MDSVSQAIDLSPAQSRAFDGAERALRLGGMVHIWGGLGRGKTTVLAALHEKWGGTRPRAQRREILAPTTFFLSAAETIRRNQERYREAESRVRTRDRTRPPWFSTSFDFTDSEPAD